MCRSLQWASLDIIAVFGLMTSPVYGQTAADSGTPLAVAMLDTDADADDNPRTLNFMLLLPPAGTRNDPAAADSPPRRLSAKCACAILLSHRHVASPPSVSPSPLLSRAGVGVPRVRRSSRTGLHHRCSLY